MEGLLEVYLSARQLARRKEIKWKDLSDGDWPPFLAAMRKEWASILDLDAVELLPPQEARLIRLDEARGRRVLKS
eukprot:2785487-Prorocentrum_lima.AAC.1